MYTTFFDCETASKHYYCRTNDRIQTSKAITLMYTDTEALLEFIVRLSNVTMLRSTDNLSDTIRTRSSASLLAKATIGCNCVRNGMVGNTSYQEQRVRAKNLSEMSSQRSAHTRPCQAGVEPRISIDCPVCGLQHQTGRDAVKKERHIVSQNIYSNKY